MVDYKDWLTEDGLTRIQGWARAGLTQAQIAKNIGCALGTFKNWIRKYPEVQEAMKKGKEVVDFEVENALFKKAMNGDTTAMIFWLKNRKPDEWRNYIERNTKKDNEEQQARIEKIVLENEKLRAEIDKIRSETATQQQTQDDGFLEALTGSAAADWTGGDDEPA